jgi:hypothetical protein
MPFGATTLEAEARRALVGVGDPILGEWSEWTGRAVHVRRRLSEVEATQVGPVVDVRGTEEALRRLRPVAHLLPAGWSE